jgi:hypothetical protein
MQAVENNDLAQAEETSARLDAELWRMSQRAKDSSPSQSTPANNDSEASPKLQVMSDALLQPILSTLSIMSLEVRGSLLMAQKRTDEAKEIFGQAEQEQKKLGYREPPAFIRPVSEAEAAAYMEIGDWANAKAARGSGRASTLRICALWHCREHRESRKPRGRRKGICELSRGLEEC